jgi:hypothetical protein
MTTGRENSRLKNDGRQGMTADRRMTAGRENDRLKNDGREGEWQTKKRQQARK